ncbi:hypothetical protein T265_01490 [Opisthorchis viverrini]|uniref:Uncharacterized protein n=1 Tax=Opisthorchis viverrini TaxID=6198 RepID=A0A075A9K5_OPIVI|nr:hypothetical protein T265_01490 [Opisthorchis viverrini]KER32435.1 hypothetical protein T265_01490 [Opisthorchis viverrini]
MTITTIITTSVSSFWWCDKDEQLFASLLVRTDNRICLVSILAAKFAHQLGPTALGVVGSVFKPGHPGCWIAFNVHTLKQAGKQTTLIWSRLGRQRGRMLQYAAGII